MLLIFLPQTDASKLLFIDTSVGMFKCNHVILDKLLLQKTKQTSKKTLQFNNIS